MAQEEVPRTMLILKSNPTSLGVVEMFLRNRGWKIHSTADLKEALSHLLKHKPTYVLLSVDHPNKNVQQLSKLLGPDYPGVVMPFAETQSSVAFNTLNNIDSDYRIYPPATGPAIERCVHRYLKDLETRPEKVGTVRGLTAEESSLYSIKGNGSSHSGVHVEKGRSGQWQPVEQADSAKRTRSMENAEAAKQGRRYENSDPDDQEQNWLNSDSGKKQQSSGDYESSQTQQKGRSYESSQQRQSAGSSLSAKQRRRMANAQAAKKQRRPENTDSVIVRGAEKSLVESVDIGSGNIDRPIHQHTNAACIVIESQRFSGYLVAVMGKDKVIDTDFIESVKVKLFKFLVDHGEEITEDEAMSIKIKQVAFEPWAIEYAEFLRKSVHKGDEVAMAFFPRQSLKAVLEESTHKDKVKIGLDDLHGDRVVDFDLYVFLPTNNKYLLYTPKGGVFYDRQLERLKQQGVTHMHINKVAAPAISKYRAENYLNDLVDDFSAGAEADEASSDSIQDARVPQKSRTAS
jgi:CheY-like chemotaxis protein